MGDSGDAIEEGLYAVGDLNEELINALLSKRVITSVADALRFKTRILPSGVAVEVVVSDVLVAVVGCVGECRRVKGAAIVLELKGEGLGEEKGRM
jgi:hypothetical protein